MKKFYGFLCLFLGFQLYGWAQQNVFTVPVPEIVEQNKLYIQPSVVITSQMKFGTILTYGLGGNFEAGITIRDFTVKYNAEHNVIPIDSVNPEENPDAIINMQKGFDLTDKLKLGIGTRSGVNIANETDLATFNYLNVQASVLNDSKITLGGYYGNDAYLDEGNNVGMLLGIEAPIMHDKIKLLADLISGNNALSVINLGLGFKVSQQWELSVGGQLPFPNSDNEYGLTLQLNN